MYKLLIADDDEIIRVSMARNTPWAQWNFEVVALFEDGQNAIEYLERHPVDVVLTDVIMYEVSGIDLARWVHTHCPSTQVVILSGYREFSFAQEAMRFGVNDYIVKPVELAELARVFSAIQQTLNDQSRPDTANLPIVFFGEEGCARIVEEDERIANAISAADCRLMPSLCAALSSHLSGAPTNVLLYCISDLLMRIYERLGQAGISASAVLPRSNLVQRLEHIRVENLLNEAMTLLCDLCTSVQVFRSTGSSVVDQVQRYIAAHLSEKISVDDIAHSVYLSSGYLNRAFRLQCGESLMDYVIRLRMQKAAALILEGKYTTAEVAQRSGYQDRAYFNRSFKKMMGCTVREYRSRTINREEKHE